MIRKQYRKLLGPYTRTSELGPKYRKQLRKQTHKKLRSIYNKPAKQWFNEMEIE